MDPTEANETVPNSEEKPITEVLDFAMREIVKQDSLTDELICPMLRMVFIFQKRGTEIIPVSKINCPHSKLVIP